MTVRRSTYFLALQARYVFGNPQTPFAPAAWQIYVPVDGDIIHVGYVVDRAIDDVVQLDIAIAEGDPFFVVTHDEDSGLEGTSVGLDTSQPVHRGDVISMTPAIDEASEGSLSFTFLIHQHP